MPLGNALVKQEWLSSYRPADKPARFDRNIQNLGTAKKINQISD